MRLTPLLTQCRQTMLMSWAELPSHSICLAPLSSIAYCVSVTASCVTDGFTSHTSCLTDCGVNWHQLHHCPLLSLSPLSSIVIVKGTLSGHFKGTAFLSFGTEKTFLNFGIIKSFWYYLRFSWSLWWSGSWVSIFYISWKCSWKFPGNKKIFHVL